jgi:phosphoglycolate phosphatase
VLSPPTSPGTDALLGNIRYVLFDFDGPLCDLFAPRHRWTRRATVRITRRLAKVLRRHGHEPPPRTSRHDPHELYRTTLDSLGPHMSGAHRFGTGGAAPEATGLASALRKCLDEEEQLAAAETAVPTPGAAELVLRLHRAGVGLAVASNNCEPAIRAHLERVDLIGCFEKAIAGRADDHTLMKPDPHVVLRAMEDLGATEDACLMIGDSVADVTAARKAGIRICAYGPSGRKRRQLLSAGADFAVGSMRDLQQAMTAAHEGIVIH